MTSANQLDQDFALVFIDDARTFGGAQIALGWAIRAIVRKTPWRVVCVCPPLLRLAIEDIVGSNSRVEFVACPSSLPVNIFSFPLRVVPFLKLLRPLERGGSRAWWLSLSGIEFGLAPLIALKLLGKKPCAWLHNPQRFSVLDRWGSLSRRLFARIRDKIADRWLFRLYSSIDTPSQASASLLQERLGSAFTPRIGHLYPTVSMESKCPGPSKPSEAGCAGEICMWMIGRVEYGTKNNELSLFLLKRLIEEGRAATLTVVGDGPDMGSLTSKVRELGMVDRVRVTGWVKNPWASLPNDSIVIIPSFCETFGLTAIEAMLRGIPIVTSPIPAFLEWVPPQMIADALTPAAFAQKIHDVQVLGRDSMLDLYANCLARFSESSFVTVLAAQLGITSATDA